MINKDKLIEYLDNKRTYYEKSAKTTGSMEDWADYIHKADILDDIIRDINLGKFNMEE